MALTLEDQVTSLRPGDHVCLLYASLDEQMTAVAPFLRVGLNRNEVCVFAGDGAMCEALKVRLASLDVAVEDEIASGRLRLLDPDTVYLSTGTFHPEETLAMLRDLIKSASAAGYSGVRTAGDMSWIIHGPPGSEHVLDYESQVNELLCEHPFVGMCQYDLSRCRAGFMRDVLRAHPIAVLGDKVCANPYYEPPHLRGDGDESRHLQWMVSNLESSRATELGLQELNRELESMTYAASHDLQEPVRMVRMHLDLLAREADSLGERGGRYLDQARRSADRLGNLVDSILDATSAQREPRSEQVQLGDVVSAALVDLAGAIDESAAVVSVAPLPTVRCDRDQIVRVFRNLIGNAIKFRRGVPEITVDCLSTVDRHLITVRDTGIGIPQQWLPQAFGMFKRLHARDAYPGHGIGLATCRRIVESHHGRIWVESREGEGSTFFVALPR